MLPHRVRVANSPDYNTSVENQFPSTRVMFLFLLFFASSSSAYTSHFSAVWFLILQVLIPFKAILAFQMYTVLEYTFVDLTDFSKKSYLLQEQVKGGLIFYSEKHLGQYCTLWHVKVFQRRKGIRLVSYVSALYLRLTITMQSLICTGLLWTDMQLVCLNDQLKHIMRQSVLTTRKIRAHT